MSYRSGATVRLTGMVINHSSVTCDTLHEDCYDAFEILDAAGHVIWAGNENCGFPAGVPNVRLVPKGTFTFSQTWNQHPCGCSSGGYGSTPPPPPAVKPGKYYARSVVYVPLNRTPDGPYRWAYSARQAFTIT